MMQVAGSNIFRALRLFFGIFMICVYLGMAALMVVNFFQWSSALTWFRWPLATVFALYGIYRCYRQVKGIDYYRVRKSDADASPENDNRVDELIKKVQNENEA